LDFPLGMLRPQEEAALDIQAFMGAVAAALIANALTVSFLYAIFWGEKQNRQGVEDHNFPWWWFIAAGGPPLLGGWCAYVALY